MNMTPIASCNMSACTFNSGGMCHTLGINVGPHAECSTFTHGSDKGGFKETKGIIGACLASNCKYNNRLECAAQDIDVTSHERHADCDRFCDRESLE